MKVYKVNSTAQIEERKMVVFAPYLDPA